MPQEDDLSWAVDPTQQAAHANRAAANNVPAPAAVNAITRGGPQGISPSVGMTQPQYVDQVADQNAWSTAVNNNPPVARFAATSPAHAAAAGGSVSQLGNVSGQVRDSYFSDVGRRWEAGRQQQNEAWSEIGHAAFNPNDTFFNIGGLVHVPLNALGPPGFGQAIGLALGGWHLLGGAWNSLTSPGSGGLDTLQRNTGFNNQNWTTVNVPGTDQTLRFGLRPGSLGDIGSGLAGLFIGGRRLRPGEQPAPGEPPHVSGGPGPQATAEAVSRQPFHTGEAWNTSADGFLADEAGNPVGFNSPRDAASWRMQHGGDQVFEPDLHSEGVGLRDVNARPADPYWETRRSREPVPGMDPQTDEVLKNNADRDAETSERVEGAVAQTPLHSQAPGLMQDFLEGTGVANRDVQVDPFALRDLYSKGHTPFSTRMDEIEDAMFRGTTMTVPYSEWLAEVSGKPFAEQVRAATVLSEGGVSQNEAGEVKDVHMSPGDTSASMTGGLEGLPKMDKAETDAFKEMTPKATDVRVNPIQRGGIPNSDRWSFTGREAAPERKDAAKAAQANAKTETVKFSDIYSPQEGVDIKRAADREPTDEEGLHGTLEKYKGKYYVRDGNHRITKALAAGETEGKFSVIDYDSALGTSAEGARNYAPPKDVPEEYHKPLRSIAAAVDGTIDEIFQEQALGKVFENPKAAGMTAAQFERYSNALDEAKYALREKVMQKLYNQIKRERTPDWKAAVELAKEEAVKSLNEHPNIIAYRNLKDPLFRLDSGSIKERYPNLAEEFPKNLQKVGGADPDDMAEILGYTSGGELVKEMILFQRAMDAVGAKTVDAFVKQSANVMAQLRARELAGFDGSPEGIRKEVEEAVTGPEMEDFLISELKVIHAMTNEPLDIEQIKSKADDMFGKMPVKQASSIKLAERAMWKTGRATEFALEKGNWVAAFKAKQQQLLNHYILRWTHEFVREKKVFENKARNYAKSPQKPGIPQEALNRIHSFLQDYGYKVPQTQLRYEYDEWQEEQRALGQAVQPYKRPTPQDISKLTVDDFRDVADRLENMIHLAKDEGLVKVLDEHLSLELLIREALDAAEPVKKKPVLADATIVKGRVSAGQANAWAFSPQRMADILDNRNPNGVFNRVLIQGARRAAVTEHDLVGPEDQAIADILKKLGPEEWNRLQRYVPHGHGLMRPDRPGLEANLKYSDLIGIMLHMGHKEGRFHLEEGGWGFNRDDYENLVKNEATPGDWELVDKIVNTVSKLWPLIAESEKELGGLVPEKVKAEPIILHKDRGVDAKGNRLVDVEVHPGGYFPLRRDDRLSSGVKGKVKVDPGSLMAHFLQEGATPKGHTIRRVAASYVPSLDWMNTIQSHIPNVAKRIAYGKWALDTLKFLSQPDIVKLIEDVHGPYAWNEFRGWLQRQLGYRSIDPRAPAELDGILRELRMRTYSTQAALKISIGLEHATSVAQTAAQAGVGTAVRGFVRWASNPFQAERFAIESSDYMRIRSEAVTRELRDIIDDIRNNRSTLIPVLPIIGRVNIPVLDPAAIKLRRWSAGFFAWFNQFFAANPAYLGAYHDAIAGKAVPAGRLKPLPAMTHEEAVSYAEKVVSLSHGSGFEMDMGTFQSGGGSEFLKTVNMWNIFRGTFGAQLREGAYHAFQGQDTEEKIAGWKQLLIGAMLVVSIAKVATDHIPKSWEEFVWWQLDNVLDGLSHMVPFGPNGYQFGSNVVTGRPPEFSISPVEGSITSAGKSVADLVNTFQHKRVKDPRAVENAAILAGMLFNLPAAGQVGETLQSIHDMQHPGRAGRVTRPVPALLFGPSHERERKNK